MHRTLLLALTLSASFATLVEECGVEPTPTPIPTPTLTPSPTPSPFLLDADGDGWRPCDPSCYDPCDAQCDCDDLNPDVFPGHPELDDGLDNDCDGVVDTCDGPDADGDGFCDCAALPSACWFACDCDDTDPAIRPGRSESFSDTLDTDCDGQTEWVEGYRVKEISTGANDAYVLPDGRVRVFGWEGDRALLLTFSPDVPGDNLVGLVHYDYDYYANSVLGRSLVCDHDAFCWLANETRLNDFPSDLLVLSVDPDGYVLHSLFISSSDLEQRAGDFVRLDDGTVLLLRQECSTPFSPFGPLTAYWFRPDFSDFDSNPFGTARCDGPLRLTTLDNGLAVAGVETCTSQCEPTLIFFDPLSGEVHRRLGLASLGLSSLGDVLALRGGGLFVTGVQDGKLLSIALTQDGDWLRTTSVKLDDNYAFLSVEDMRPTLDDDGFVVANITRTIEGSLTSVVTFSEGGYPKLANVSRATHGTATAIPSPDGGYAFVLSLHGQDSYDAEYYQINVVNLDQGLAGYFAYDTQFISTCFGDCKALCVGPRVEGPVEGE